MERPESPRLSTLRQERSRRTRERLIGAARELWRENGFDHTTVSALCRHAGVSKGTFYFYFQRKEDLLLELAAHEAEATFGDWEIVKRNGGSARELLQGLVLAIAVRTELLSRPLLARTVRELFASAGEWPAVRGDRRDFRDMFEQLYTLAQDGGELDADADPRDLASMSTAVALQAELAWATGNAESLGDLLSRRCGAILTGALAGSVTG